MDQTAKTCHRSLELRPLHDAAAQMTAGQRAALLEYAHALLTDTPNTAA